MERMSYWKADMWLQCAEESSLAYLNSVVCIGMLHRIYSGYRTSRLRQSWMTLAASTRVDNAYRIIEPSNHMQPQPYRPIATAQHALKGPRSWSPRNQRYSLEPHVLFPWGPALRVFRSPLGISPTGIGEWTLLGRARADGCAICVGSLAEPINRHVSSY